MGMVCDASVAQGSEGAVVLARLSGAGGVGISIWRVQRLRCTSVVLLLHPQRVPCKCSCSQPSGFHAALAQ